MQYDVLCVDNEFGSGAKCGPKQQIIELATADWTGTGSAQADPVEWSDGTEVVVQVETCAPTVEPTFEPTMEPSMPVSEESEEGPATTEAQGDEAANLRAVYVYVLCCVLLLFA